jgi:serine/threonine protein kinase/tetratricopeptide (TPR) repeat protein
MKHFSPGLSDSIASVIADPPQCPHCDSSSRIGGGLCVGCLLQSGLDPGDECAPETLVSALAEVTLPDKNWRLGNYEILEEIGRGGMGVIYRARQRHSRRIVAVKRVLGYHADSRETLARFRREAQAAASLDHPNILPIYEVSESEDGLPFFSMKFAPGGNLQEVGPALRKDPRQCVTLVAKIARAVQYAHGKGILHRDLKPGNILLDGSGEPLVSDFGLAKWLDTTSDLTRTLTIFGTPGYIAPEQASGSAAQLKPAADVYSLGAILFDLVAGRPPFLGSQALSVIRQATETTAPKLRSLSKIADRDLETICSRCLEREPSARYPSARDLAEDLERWLEGRPIIARRTLPPVRVWRWAKRTPKLAGSVAACLALGAAALIWQVQSRQLGSVVQQNQLAARSITVLPLLDLDSVQPDSTRASTVAKTLKDQLSALGPVRVVPISNGPSWVSGSGDLRDIREANRNLKSRAVLTGTQRMVNGKLRLSLRLMNAANGDVLFVQTVEVDPHAVANSTFARTIAPAIHSVLNAPDWSKVTMTSHDPGMQNPASREFIISGRQLMFRGTIEDFDASIRCLEKALTIEPNSAIAHAYLCSTQTARVHFVPDAQLLDRAEREAREALRLEPNLPDAHRGLAGVFFHRNQFAEALEEQLRAVEAGGPEERVVSFIGWTLITLGQPNRALNWLEMAKHWTSVPGSHDTTIGDCWTLLHEDEKAETAYRRAMDLRPEVPDGWVGLCYLRILQGNLAAARQVYQENQTRSKAYEGWFNDNHPSEMLPRIELFSRNYRAAEPLYAALAKGTSTGGIAAYGGMSSASALGRIRQALGDEAGARTILAECLTRELDQIRTSKNAPALYRIAAIEASLGNVDAAITHLRAAASVGWIDYRSLQLDPRFDAIASDARFHEIISVLTTKVAELRRQTGQPTTMAAIGERSSP